MFRKTNAIASTGSGNDDILRGLIEREVTSIKIPEGISKIGVNAFHSCSKLTSVTIPNSVTAIENGAFEGTGITSIEIPSSVKSLGSRAFYTSRVKIIKLNEGLTTIGNYCWQGGLLEEIKFPSTLTSIGYDLFRHCPLKKAYIPKLSIPVLSAGIFNYCSMLEEVTIENGFNSNKLTLNGSTLYATETIVSWLEALADRTGQATYTLTIGATNLAKLSSEQIAIATAKNWTLA